MSKDPKSHMKELTIWHSLQNWKSLQFEQQKAYKAYNLSNEIKWVLEYNPKYKMNTHECTVFYINDWISSN